MKTIKIVGLPGTGKTTELSKILERKIDAGYTPGEIMYSSFSRATSRAILDKMALYGYVEQTDLPWFRTLHSLAWRALGLDRAAIVTTEDKARFCADSGVPYQTEHTRTLAEVEQFGTTDTGYSFEIGNFMFRWWQMLKKRYVTTDEVAAAVREQRDLTPTELTRVREYPPVMIQELFTEWEMYKKRSQKYEFDDALQRVIQAEVPFPVPLKCIVIDEAQDLNALQFKMITQWLYGIEEFYLAYDVNQRIYFFNCADSSLAKNLEGETRVLARSYRVQGIAQQMGNHEMADVAPKDADGGVEQIDVSAVMEHLRREKRSVYMLFRTHAQIERMEEQLANDGIMCRGMGRAHTDADSPYFRSVCNLMHELYAGEERLNMLDIARFVRAVPARYLRERGMKTAIANGKYDFQEYQSTLSEDEISANQTTQFFSLFRNVETVADIRKIIADPATRLAGKDTLLALSRTHKLDVLNNVFMGTTYAAKGLAAWSVYLFDYKPHRDANVRRDEFPLGFVGATRTENMLYIVSPTYLTKDTFGEGMIRDLVEGFGDRWT